MLGRIDWLAPVGNAGYHLLQITYTHTYTRRNHKTQNTKHNTHNTKRTKKSINTTNKQAVKLTFFFLSVFTIINKYAPFSLYANSLFVPTLPNIVASDSSDPQANSTLLLS